MIPDRPAGTSEPPDEKAGPAAVDKLAPIALDLFCQRCGYNLKGLTSDRCPECGKSLETVRLIEPQIPWVHRKRLGRFRAYWKTVYLAMFHQGRFCEEMARPVSYSDSQRFRWVTILHVYIPILLATICAYQLAPPEPVVMTRSFQVPGGWTQSGPPWFERAYAEIWPVAVLHVCFLLFLAAATGVHSYYFHPRDLPVHVQNRAIALSYYAHAPLAWTPVPIGLAVAAWWLAGSHELTAIGLIAAAVPLLLLELACWWSAIAGFLRDTMPGRKAHFRLVAIALPFLWLALAGVIFFGVSLVVFCVLVVFASLT
ncbi:MAG: hypothetical protein JSU86_03810 [Phycisphaerales bacterium]|nr:MAG: hypothetical protein JSU86_03810 [Phycisphaerales bacterium]